MPVATAGFSDWWGKITGKATAQDVTVSIVVGAGTAPTIPFIENATMTDLSSSGPTEGPALTWAVVNFTVYDANGYDNIDDGTALVNYTNGTAGNTRTNSSCALLTDYSTNYANYTCNITMWWWDGSGTWTIQAYIKDLNENAVTNNTATFQLGTTGGAGITPTSLAWTGLTAGALTTDSDEPFLLNNTGNLVKYIELNATDLTGETNEAESIWADNITAKGSAGCGGTAMVNTTFKNITGLVFPIGNYTVNDGRAQEQVYVCIEEAGPELDAQTYSTTDYGAWNLKVVSP